MRMLGTATPAGAIVATAAFTAQPCAPFGSGNIVSHRPVLLPSASLGPGVCRARTAEGAGRCSRSTGLAGPSWRGTAACRPIRGVRPSCVVCRGVADASRAGMAVAIANRSDGKRGGAECSAPCSGTSRPRLTRPAAGLRFVPLTASTAGAAVVKKSLPGSIADPLAHRNACRDRGGPPARFRRNHVASPLPPVARYLPGREKTSRQDPFRGQWRTRTPSRDPAQLVARSAAASPAPAPLGPNPSVAPVA